MRRITFAIFGGAMSFASGCGDVGDMAGLDFEGGSSDAESVSSTGEELLGGTATNLRPEIGTLGFCTATLVDQSYIITASHCFDYRSGPRSDTFTIHNTSGTVVMTRTVDHAYAYGGSLGETDIAFAHLSVPVPFSVATATSIGGPPTSGEQVSAFGYGCTGRPDNGQSGTKRFVNYSFGTTSINCPRDSGGPRLHGFAGTGGSIWGINSGYRDFFGTDINGDAATYGPAVLRGVRAFAGTSYKNNGVADFPGWATAARNAVGGDFDGNGRADVALVGGSGWTTVPVAFGNGSGGYNVTNRSVANFPGWAAAARHAVGGDFDGDGDTDIALLGGPGWITIPIAFSNRDGTFTVTNVATPNLPGWAQAVGAYGVAGDFDADGDADLALLGGAGWVTIPMGFSTRNGGFSQTNTGVANFPLWSRTQGARGVAGDFDADGDADLALTGGSGWTTIPVAFSNRVGGFSVTNSGVSDFPAWSRASGVKIVAGDFDGDGDADIAGVGGGGWRTIAFARSIGNGTFSSANLPIADIPGWSIAARFVLVGRADTGSTSDLILTGGSGWVTMPTVFLRP